MAKVDRFEDLKCWQKARELVNQIYELSKTGPLSKDYRLRDQLRSAAVSIMSNIAEGFSRYHNREFVRFLDIAQSSAAEVKSLMYVVLDQGYASLKSAKNIQKLTDDCRYLTLGLLKYCDQNIKSTNEIKEPEAKYLEEEVNILNLPDNFINIEHLNTRTPEHFKYDTRTITSLVNIKE